MPPENSRLPYEELRRRWGSVAPVEILPSVTAWLVLDHQAALEVIWNERLFSSDARRWNAGIDPGWAADAPQLVMLGPRPLVSRLDAQEHRRQRHALTGVLDQIDLPRLRRLVQQQADHLVDRWAPRATADLVAEYSRPLTWTVFAHLFGFSPQSIPALEALVDAVTGTADDAAYADAELLEAMRRLVNARVATPGPDLASWLTHATPLTDTEIAHNLVQLLLFGATSTVNWVGNALRLLLSDSLVSSSVATGRLTPSDVLDRTLMDDPPIPNIAGRWATEDIMFAGHAVRAGDLLIPCLAAANNDPAILGGRAVHTSGRAHLAWGTGAHGCPAKDMARLIAETAVDVALRRLGEPRLDTPGSATVSRQSLWCSGPAELPVAFTPVHPEHRTEAPPELPDVLPVPERTRTGDAEEGETTQRWGWWNSMTGW
ncbi:cytochrome P450 [Streptomyces sp. NPDC058251]|uniref:cytochrome P450 n=1 Tax=Streptomyces sp. NPDC058251 TaxID=3346404 RepID=UPI0036EA6DD5